MRARAGQSVRCMLRYGRVLGTALGCGCWWCEKSRQSREHLFKKCTAWTKEIRKLRTEVGRASGKRESTSDPFNSRKGLAYRIRQARARPSNTSIRDLLSDGRYTEAVLEFLETKGWGRSRRESCVNKR